MSFQYINPYLIPKYGAMPQAAQMTQYVQSPYVNMQNPYQASFYAPNSVFPYNPLFAPKIPQSYISLGQIKSPSDEMVYLYQLANGQKVAIMPRKDEATIVKTFLDGGSMNETDPMRGISHCIEHCLFKGSSKLEDGDVFRLTSLMGASTNASTDFAQTDYYITAPYMDKDNLQKTIEIQGDMISNPKFEEGAIESEKGPICSEISMINDDAVTIAFDKVIRNLFQIDSSSHNLVAGSIETVSNLSRNDLVNHHKKFYTPDNLYTVVVGDVDVQETIESIAKNFTIPVNNTGANTAQRKEILTPTEKPVREDIRSTKTNYTSVIMAFSGPKPQNSKDFVIGKMIDYYLGSCSTSDLKNKLEKINGDYSSTLQKVGLQNYDPYALVSVVAVNPSDEQKGIDIFYDAIQKLQTEPLSDEDMLALQNYIKKGLEYMMCDSTSICDMLGSCFLDNSLDLFVNYKGLAQNITKQDIMEYARKYYDLNKVSMVVVHPASVTESEIEANYAKSKYSLKNVQSKNAAAISFCGSPKISTEGVEEMILPNKTRLALNDNNSNLCVFSWNVNTPPIKPKNPNIPAVLRYMFQKGTNYRNQNELERYKELNGIDADVYVNGKSIEIDADCMPENAEKTLALLNELMYSPKLTQADFDVAKAYVKDALKASQKDATSNLLDSMYPGYFPTEAEKLRTIDSLTLKDVQEFYQELLKNASSAFVVTGPFSRYPGLGETVKNYQSASNITFRESVPKLSPIFEPNPEANVIYDTDDLNQAQIYKSYKFPLSGNIEDEAKFELVNAILGGSPNARLFSDLREKQNLAYSVSSSIQSFENTGIVTLKIQTTTDHKDQGVQSYDNVQKALEGFNKHTTLLCGELVSDEELEAAKMKLKQNVIGQSQNPHSETDLLALNIVEPYGIKRIDKYIDAIEKVTKEDIRQAANFIFSHNPTTSILASEDTINSQLEYLATQGKLQQA